MFPKSLKVLYLNILTKSSYALLNSYIYVEGCAKSLLIMDTTYLNGWQGCIGITNHKFRGQYGFKRRAQFKVEGIRISIGTKLLGSRG